MLGDEAVLVLDDARLHIVYEVMVVELDAVHKTVTDLGIFDEAVVDDVVVTPLWSRVLRGMAPWMRLL